MRIYSVNRGDRMLVRFKILWSQAVSTKHDRRCTDELDLLRTFPLLPCLELEQVDRGLRCLDQNILRPVFGHAGRCAGACYCAR